MERINPDDLISRRNGSDVPLHEVQVSLERSDVQHVHHVRHGYEFNR